MRKISLAIMISLVVFSGCSSDSTSIDSATPPPIVQPKPSEKNDTSDWKTYQNSEFGFALKYPSTLTVDENVGSSNFMTRFVVVDIDTPEHIKILNAIEGAEPPPLFLRIVGSKQSSPQECNPDYTLSTVTLDGIFGMKCVGTNDVYGPGELSLSIKKDGETSLFIQSYKYLGTDLPLIDQIISTITFTPVDKEDDKDNKDDDKNDETEALETKTIMFSEPTFTMTLPEGWRKNMDPSSGGRVQGDTYGVLFEDGSGHYIYISVDHPGRGFGADQVWSATYLASKLAITKDSVTCDKTSPSCMAGDGRLDIGIKVNQDILGHTYFFLIGNHESERASTDIQEAALGSIEFK